MTLPTAGRWQAADVRRPWLTRNLVVLTLVSLTQDAASELLYPLLPLLLTGVLAAPPVVLGAGRDRSMADRRRERPRPESGPARA